MRLEESLKERSPRAGAREARAGRCLSIRDAVGLPRQQVALRGSLYCRPLALSARMSILTFTSLFRISDRRACQAARAGAISSSSSYAYAVGAVAMASFIASAMYLTLPPPPPSHSLLLLPPSILRPAKLGGPCLPASRPPMVVLPDRALCLPTFCHLL